MYGKLDNGLLIRAPKMLDVEDTHVYNPDDAQLRAAGYKPVEYTDPPETPGGYYAEPGWEENSDTIVQTWTLTPLPDDLDDAEALEILLGGDDK